MIEVLPEVVWACNRKRLIDIRATRSEQERKVSDVYRKLSTGGNSCWSERMPEVFQLVSSQEIGLDT